MILVKNILVTGADGQLGRCFQQVSTGYNSFNYFFCNSQMLDITDTKSVKEFLENNDIHYLINCAAYTAVDKAEEEKEKSLALNASAPAHLAEICKLLNIQFIHFSTDYVFDGKASAPYLPTDKTDPVNFYGYTKLEGERKVIDANPSSLIIRTSWVYSPFGKNFVKTMINLMATKESINVVNDQLGSPTYAVDLAEAILNIIQSSKAASGIYHYCNRGIISWDEFASEIKKLINSSCVINAVSTKQYPTAAKRPSFSALNQDSFRNDFMIDIPNWKDSLAACVTVM